MEYLLRQLTRLPPRTQLLFGRSDDEAGPLGRFARLPTEINFMIFACLSLDDVGNFALTSKRAKALAASYLISKASLRRVMSLPSKMAQEVGLQWNPKTPLLSPLMPSLAATPKAFAIFCKRISMLMGTPERLKLGLGMFDRGIGDFNSTDWKTTLYAVQFCYMVHVFTLGWDECEYHNLMARIDRKFDLTRKMNRFFGSSRRADVCVGFEMQLRLILRCLIWECAGDDYGHRAAWLMCVFKYFVGDCWRRQAMILYLLFGPACPDGDSHYDDLSGGNKYAGDVMKVIHNHADWDAFTETSPIDFHDGKGVFYTLAQATCSIVNYSAEWGAEALPDVLLELFKTPEPWEQDNVAGFLLFCSERVILMYLKCLLDQHDSHPIADPCPGSSINHVAGLLVDMIRVSHRFENYLSHEKGIGKIFDQILDHPADPRRRACLRKSIWNVIGNYLANGIDENEDIDLIEIVKNIGKHLMSAAYTKLNESRTEGGNTAAKATEDGDIDDKAAHNEAFMSEE